MWLALDRQIGRTVAVKELLRKNDPRSVARFRRESSVTARLQHPAIIPVYEISESSTGEPFLTMRCVDGRPLEEFIFEASTPEDRLRLLPSVLAAVDALAYAHGQHVIHRDIKPSNILLGLFGDTVVIDWGLAKDLTETPGVPTDDDPEAITIERGTGPGAGADGTLTHQGAVMGTPAYMSPEQAAGAEVDERSDVYSLGAVIYHVITGISPFRGKTSREVLARVLTEEPEPIERLAPWISKDLASIVKRAMARKSEARYASARELAEDLRRYLSGSLVGSIPYAASEFWKGWTWSPKRRRGAALALLLVFGACALVGIAIYHAIYQAGAISGLEQLAASRQDEVVKAYRERGEADARAVKTLREADTRAARALRERDEARAQLANLDSRLAPGHERPPSGPQQERDTSAEKLLASAIAKVQGGDPAGGVVDLKACVANEPSRNLLARCWKNMSIAYSKTGDTRKAAEALMMYLPFCEADCEQIRGAIAKWGG